jgi:hypothetical protein
MHLCIIKFLAILCTVNAIALHRFELVTTGMPVFAIAKLEISFHKPAPSDEDQLYSQKQ